MRSLTKKQKELLDKTLKKNDDIRTSDDLPIYVWEELEKINDTEILYQEVDRYISDQN